MPKNWRRCKPSSSMRRRSGEEQGDEKNISLVANSIKSQVMIEPELEIV
jgi:hypothetical protein